MVFGGVLCVFARRGKWGVWCGNSCSWGGLWVVGSVRWEIVFRGGLWGVGSVVWETVSGGGKFKIVFYCGKV